MEPDRPPRTRKGDRGETLIEALVSVVVIAAVAVTAMQGLATSQRAGIDQRVSARGETILRSAAEQIQNPDLAYIERAGCPGETSYSVPPLVVSEAGYEVSVGSVSFWTGASATPTASLGLSFATGCPVDDSADPGLQEIELRLSDPLGRSDSLTVLKRRS